MKCPIPLSYLTSAYYRAALAEAFLQHISSDSCQLQGAELRLWDGAGVYHSSLRSGFQSLSIGLVNAGEGYKAQPATSSKNSELKV